MPMLGVHNDMHPTRDTLLLMYTQTLGRVMPGVGQQLRY